MSAILKCLVEHTSRLRSVSSKCWRIHMSWLVWRSRSSGRPYTQSVLAVRSLPLIRANPAATLSIQVHQATYLANSLIVHQAAVQIARLGWPPQGWRLRPARMIRFLHQAATVRLWAVLSKLSILQMSFLRIEILVYFLSIVRRIHRVKRSWQDTDQLFSRGPLSWYHLVMLRRTLEMWIII